MALIRKYGDFPAAFVPDQGEVVLASRSPAGPFLKAAVVLVRRAARDRFRVDFVWMEGSPSASVHGVSYRAGDKGHVYITENDPVPLIRRMPADRQ